MRTAACLDTTVNLGRNVHHPRPLRDRYFRIYMIAILTCLGSWLLGYNIGVIGGTIVLPSFHHDFALAEVGTTEYNNVVSNIISLFQIGGLCGSMLTFPVAKYLGRTKSLSLSSIIYVIGAALQTFCSGRLNMMFAGRFFTGIGAGGATVVVPLYLAELSPPSIRGSIVGVYEINNQLSSLLGYWCNYIVAIYIPGNMSRQWQIPLAMQLVPSILLVFVSLFVLPESAHFLLQGSNPDRAKALRVLARIRNRNQEDPSIVMEIDAIENAILQQQATRRRADRFGLLKEVTWKGNRNRVITGVCLMLGQNMTGINAVNFYTPTIFRSIGFTGTDVLLLASGMFAMVKSIATIFSLLVLIDRTGRRTLLLASSLGSSLSLWYIGGFVTAANIDLNMAQAKTPAGWLAIVCVYLYAASFSLAWNGVVWIYCSEIFPMRIKELAICITTAMTWISQFAIARSAPYMLASLRGGFFLFFAAAIFIMGLGIWWCVPETKGRTLEEMDVVFGNAYELRLQRRSVIIDQEKKGDQDIGQRAATLIG